MLYLRDAEDDWENVLGGTEEKSEEMCLTVVFNFFPRVETELAV